MNDNATQLDAALLPHFATHSLLDALGRLTEASQGGVKVLRPALLASEQQTFPVVADDSRDDSRVGAREAQIGDAVACCARRSGCGRGCCAGGLSCREQRKVGRRADALRSGIYGKRGLTAAAAEGVARVPVEERTGLAEDSSW